MSLLKRFGANRGAAVGLVLLLVVIVTRWRPHSMKIRRG